ncbi:MAG: SDR family oxidoreductase [Sphingomonadaceae bacterium]|uniref:SDR family NAD(P)-dependent oxidoreductase n=1 Tax=Thermaurantiacus sp. TaxID=2820283 RepID=UPI00298EE947|nr:SDR family oxidoreductase [Thermaurantiacus sp.]MCS6985857.1 SDR family oxidoreductase [Sphingomonadaceae bacterium]MDW8413874.1 SDR family oxidoreductase [Thermaurantiacus sp.]
MTGRLANKTAVVVGASGQDNAGQAIARRFAREGARVLVAGRRREPLEALAAEIGGVFARVDIRFRAQVEALRDTALTLLGGRVDILVNCAGIGLLRPLEEVTEDDLELMSALQFKGVHHLLQAFVPVMAAQGGGSIIQISSATTDRVIDDHAAYIATKAAGDALMRCIANQYGAKGIRANSLVPGLMATPMTAEALKVPGLEARFAKEYPLGRIGTVEDLAAAAVFVASDECFMTGQALQVNGGLTLRRNPLSAELFGGG